MKARLDLSHFEQLLLEMQLEVMGIADLVDDAAQTVELDQSKVGRLSRMDAIQGQAMAQASVERQSHTLLLIGEALARIDEGQYGLCLECDETIAVARLEIDPSAKFCIKCAQKKET